MKVCFVAACPGTDMRGGPRSLLETIDTLKKQGVECFVLLPASGRLMEELNSRGIPSRVISYKRWIEGLNYPIWKLWRKIVWNLFMAVAIALQIRQWQCDIVYTNTISIGVGALAAVLLGKPHVWHIREFVYEDHAQGFIFGRNYTLKLVDRFSQICIVNSQAVAQKYQQFITPSKLKVIYQAVVTPDTAAVTLPTTNFKCIVVGALVEGKRQEDAIRAIAHLVHTGISVELEIVGDGDYQYQQYLKAIVSEKLVEKYVRFTGYVDNSFALMQNANAVLVCSRCEAFGRVTVEGMRAGKPVIGARSGGTQELIQDGFNGFLYTVANDRDLAEKIRFLYEHPEMAKQMGENGREWAAKQFSQERYGTEINMVLKQLCAKTNQIIRN